MIRGVESNGMLCSAAELQLSEDHDGIIDLPADAPVGQPYVAYAGLSDPVIEIAVTPTAPMLSAWPALRAISPRPASARSRHRRWRP